MTALLSDLVYLPGAQQSLILGGAIDRGTEGTAAGSAADDLPDAGASLT